MSNDKKTIEDLKEILRVIEFITYSDPEEGVQVFCPFCVETPERKRVPGFPPLYEPIPGTGHDKDCKIWIALYGS